MDYIISVVCKKCHDKLSPSKPYCSCGNVAIDRIKGQRGILLLFVDDLKTVQFYKAWFNGRKKHKETLLPPNYRFNWSIVDGVSFKSKALLKKGVLKPVKSFSGQKFLRILKDWFLYNKLWIKGKGKESFEDVYEDILNEKDDKLGVEEK